MLIKRTERQTRRSSLAAAIGNQTAGGYDRRSFLRKSGLVAGGLATIGVLPLASVRKAEAAGPNVAAATIRKNICTHCSVGCTVIAEVSNGVWVGQEPGWDSPINRGSHCAKGAATRELVHGDRRLRYPMKLVDGQWTRISWDVAINEIGDKLLEIRAKSGADSVYWLGSAKFTNEGAYLNRKLAAFWGTNNSDHQARICHSTTVAGVANTWGYGAMTNSYTDIRNSKTLFFLGGNPAEAHPVSLQHLLEGKELNRANFIVADPRLTRTAAHATEYVRLRPGTDIPVIYGMLWHIFKNGWEDKQFIEQRVYGMDDIRKAVEKWDPAEVERVSGVPGAQLERVAKMFATEKPSCLIWAMGQTQHTVGTANVRASCILLLATGNVGGPGKGANIFRGHTNVQGATDLGLDIVTLPLYYGLIEGAWRHWSRVWEVPYDWFVDRFDKSTGGGRQGYQHNEHAGYSIDPVVRRHAPRQEGCGPEGQHQVHVRHGPRRQYRDAHSASAKRHRKARTCWWSAIRIPRLGRRWRRSARTAPICCRSRPATRPMVRAPHPIARSNGASRSSSRSSSRRTTTR